MVRDLFDGHLPPGEVLRRLLSERSWTQTQLATITGRSRKTINEIMGGKAGISPSMAVALAAAFGNDPAEWLRLKSTYQLSQIRGGSFNVERRAHLYDFAPVRDMQRRGWIKDTRDTDELEAEIKRFYGIASLEEQPALFISTRRSNTVTHLSLAQIAWAIQARRLALTLQVAPYNPSRLPQAAARLKELAAYPQEVRHVPKVLASYGVRFVVVEPLPGSKIDGAAFWLESGPVIATSIRFDRVDAFWHTVMHEFSHVRHEDALSLDTLSDTANGTDATEQTEMRANIEAATALVPADELDSFIRRVGPLYSRQRVIQFAHKLKIHPGIIVGQLQHRGEIGYAALRDLLVKIRDVVVSTALTDGWGRSISPGMV